MYVYTIIYMFIFVIVFTQDQQSGLKRESLSTAIPNDKSIDSTA